MFYNYFTSLLLLLLVLLILITIIFIGVGSLSYADGDKYIGEWIEGKKSGK